MKYPDHRSQIMAFCGHDPFCADFNSERALAAAKENVDRHYAVVGVIEELNKTLEVMEAFMPDVFPGAFELYHIHPEIRQKQNRNAFNIPVAEDVLETVRRSFTREIEFYEFCRQRLDRQHE